MGVRGQTKHVGYPSFFLARSVCSLRVVFFVVVQMASLAHRLEVFGVTVLRRVIHVCRCQYHLAASPVRRAAMLVRAASAVGSTSALTFAFTAPASPALDRKAHVLPVIWVSLSVFRSYRHTAL
jgi:hypothetical protein